MLDVFDIPVLPSFREWLAHTSITNLLATFAIIVFLLVVRAVVVWVVRRRTEDLDLRVLWRQAVDYVIIAFSVLLVVNVWLGGFTEVFAVLSLVAAALTIISKELILNLIAWPIITWRRLFRVGDRVQVSDYTGDVVNLGILFFTLIEADAEGEPTGRVVKVPNLLVLTTPVINFSRWRPMAWQRFVVVLAPESDWRAAEELLLDLASRHTPAPDPEEVPTVEGIPIHMAEAPLAPTVHTHVQDRHLTVTLRYTCVPERQAAVERALWRDLLDATAARDDLRLALSA